MTKRNPTEKDVKKGIQIILSKRGWFWWMTPTGTFYGRSGVSDICALKAGVFLAIEAKLNAEKNPPTVMQKAFLTSINAESAYGFVVDAERLPVLDAFLAAFAAATGRVQGGQTTVSKSDEELMLNCVRTLTWGIV